VVGKRLEIVEICGQGGSTRLRKRDDECVDGRTSTRLPAQQRSASREWFGNLLHDIARLEEAVRERVATSMTS